MDSLIEDAEEMAETERDPDLQLVEEEMQEADESEPTVGATDDELADMLSGRDTNITVFGCGGAGSNTVTRMNEEDAFDDVELVAANTDVQHLLQNTEADTKLVLGEPDNENDPTDGRGAGAIPARGQEAALQSQDEVRQLVSNEDMVFITAGMGGGTGTGSAHVVAALANKYGGDPEDTESGALTVAVVGMPFTSEGAKRRNNAIWGLRKLKETADTVIVVPNDRVKQRINQINESLGFRESLKIADDVLMRSVRGVTELISESGMVNVDFADVQTVMQDGDVALIGLGESRATQNKAEDSVRDALNNPLLDVDISTAEGVLVNVTGGPSMTIDEAEGVVQHVSDQIDEDARIIWGASVDDDADDMLQTMVAVTGVSSPQIYAGDKTPSADDLQQISNE